MVKREWVIHSVMGVMSNDRDGFYLKNMGGEGDHWGIAVARQTKGTFLTIFVLGEHRSQVKFNIVSFHFWFRRMIVIAVCILRKDKEAS